MAVRFFVNPGPFGARSSKSYSSYTFHPISAKLYEGIGYYGVIQAITFLAIGQLKKMWYFVILM